MKNLSRRELKQIIKLEMKQIMDEDALFRGHDVPGDDDEYGDYSLDSMKSGCGSDNSMQHNTQMDVALDNLFDMGAQHVDVDFKSHHAEKSYMAKPQLDKIARYAQKLHDMIEDGETLQDWQESKIAQMSQMIGDVYHSIEYHEEYDNHYEDELDVDDLIGMIRTGNI